MKPVACALTAECGQKCSLLIDESGCLHSFGQEFIGSSASEPGSRGVLGHGDDVKTTLALPTPLPSVRAVRFCGVAVCKCHCLALDEAGRVFAWGEGSKGQLGLGDEGREGRCYRTAPALVSALKAEPVCAVACGAAHSLALAASGTLYSWGSGDATGHEGRVVSGEVDTRTSTPRRVDALREVAVRALAAGPLLSLAASAGGELYSWGEPDPKTLGRPLAPKHGSAPGVCWASAGGPPARVEGVEGVSATSCGERHALVLTADGAVYAWGYGAAGTSPPVASSPLGLGDMQPRASPSRVEGLPPRVRGVAACHMHSLAVSEEGQVYSWGHGALGKLGHGDQGRQLKPTLVSELDGVCVASVAGGVHHSVAVAADGRLYSWGDVESRGLAPELRAELTADGTPPEERWAPREHPGLRCAASMM